MCMSARASRTDADDADDDNDGDDAVCDVTLLHYDACLRDGLALRDALAHNVCVSVCVLARGSRTRTT